MKLLQFVTNLQFIVRAYKAVPFIGLFVVCNFAHAQTTTNYSYDVHGRLVEVDPTVGDHKDYLYDNANNRISIDTTVGSGGGGSGGSGNIPPSCSNITATATFNFVYVLGTQSCSDSDGGTVTIQSVTQPSNGGAAYISNGYIVATGLSIGVSTLSRTVVDGQGGSSVSTLTITNTGGGF